MKRLHGGSGGGEITRGPELVFFFFFFSFCFFFNCPVSGLKAFMSLGSHRQECGEGKIYFSPSRHRKLLTFDCAILHTLAGGKSAPTLPHLRG